MMQQHKVQTICGKLFIDNVFTLLDGSDFDSPTVLTGIFSVGGDDEICFLFTISSDNCLEDTEYFLVELSSSDHDVDIHISTATINILDSDCKCRCWVIVAISIFHAFRCDIWRTRTGVLCGGECWICQNLC